MGKDVKRKLAAILSADVAGYSRLMDNNEVYTVRTLQAYQKIISDLTEQHNGRVVDSPGDNVMAEFTSVVDAVQCSVEIQQVLKSKNDELTENRRMEFRIGINLGDVIEENNRIYGDGVNIAARVESLADAGGISISGTAYDQVVNKIDLKYENLGKHQVKNIKRPVRVYKIPIKIEYEEKVEESTLDSVIDISVPTDKPSIAVLPFVNMSDDPSQEYFSDGMTEEIITALSKVPDVLVIASTSMFTYKGQRVRVQQIGKELGVKYVLEGSVRWAGDRIRLTAQLIDTKDGKHIWADRFDRDIKEIFELQDDLATRIIEEIGIKLYYGLNARWNIKRANSLEAYLIYWQGLKYLMIPNKNNINEARKLFEQVIKIDPDWAVGYSVLGLAYIMDFIGGWTSSQDTCIEQAMRYAKKAFTIDPTLPGPHSIFSYINLFKRKYDEAIFESQTAIDLQPEFFIGYFSLSFCLIFLGEPNHALEVLKNAKRLHRKHPIISYYLAIAY